MSTSIFSQPPPITPVRNISLPVIHESTGASGIPIFEIRKSGTGILKLDMVFTAGRPFEDKKLVSSSCAGLLRDGAGPWRSKQLADYVGYYGASLDVHASLDTISIELVCLKKYFHKFIRPLRYILNQPHFKEKELRSFVKRRSQKLKVDLNKNEVVAYRELTEVLFGPDHPYGYNSSEELYNQLTREDLIRHFESFMHASRCMIFIAGDVSEDDHKRVVEISGLVRNVGVPVIHPHLPLAPDPCKSFRTSGSPNQSSIKIGRRLFKRNHPDYLPLSFLNTVLGGFFGSRLVHTLREKEGLTYGIFSSVDTLLHDGLLMISTDVAAENVERSLDLIYYECERLQNEAISTEEMEHVRNYFMGIILHLFDGPFNSIRAIKSLALSEIPTSEINSLIELSQAINPQDLLALAQKYLNRNDFWEVVVGSRSHNM